METRFGRLIWHRMDAGFRGGLNPKNSINIDKLTGFFYKFSLLDTRLNNKAVNH